MGLYATAGVCSAMGAVRGFLNPEFGLTTECKCVPPVGVLPVA